MWACNLRLLFRVADYRYFREIADYMKMKIPLINHEIEIEQNISCIVHGIRKIQYDPHQQAEVETKQSQTHEQEPLSANGPQVEQREQPQYIFEQHSKLNLNFKQALLASKSLNLDLCLIRTATSTLGPILSVSPICKNIYSDYFHTHIKRKGKNSFKTIRFTDRINKNDMLTKYNNIKRLHGQGERRFKLEIDSDSDKAQKVLINFGEMFGKKVSPQLKTVKIPPKYKEQERWSCMLVFDQEVTMDIDKVNKKWRRRKIDQSQRQLHQEEYDDMLQNQPRIQVQRELFQTYKELKLKMPAKYQQIADLEEKLKTDKHAIYRQVIQDPSNEPEYEWDEEQQQKYEKKQAKFNREFFGERTVEEIISQMQALKESGYQSEAFKVARFRQLKAELDALTKRHNNDI